MKITFTLVNTLQNILVQTFFQILNLNIGNFLMKTNNYSIYFISSDFSK